MILLFMIRTVTNTKSEKVNRDQNIILYTNSKGEKAAIVLVTCIITNALGTTKSTINISVIKEQYLL